MGHGRASKGRLLLFAFGDFAFNLYWQSVMLFLLFYYTDAIDLPIAIAATTYMLASVWDGIANFVAGILVDRRHVGLRYGRLLTVGAVPLSLSFVLAYLPPGSTTSWGIALVFAGHLIFRTAYAAVNVPYLAMTARVSPHEGDRALVAGVRMLFGTAAAVLVALCTVPLGRWLTGSSAAQAYLGAAMIFAALGAVILLIVGSTFRELAPVERAYPTDVKAALASLIRNRAFVALNAAMVAMIVAVTVLNKSVLYYFKYLLDDPAAGELALASMAAVSAVAIPLWMLLGRVAGLRNVWLLASGSAMAGLVLFAAVDVHGAGIMQIFLVGMQATIVGLHFAFWGMLPNVIEFGERETGVHVEGAVFGVAALLQRVGIGVATAILGWSFASAGYVANVKQGAETLADMRATVVIVPLAFFGLSCLAMLMNPLGRSSARSTRAAAEPQAA